MWAWIFVFVKSNTTVDVLVWVATPTCREVVASGLDQRSIDEVELPKASGPHGTVTVAVAVTTGCVQIFRENIASEYFGPAYFADGAADVATEGPAECVG